MRTVTATAAETLTGSRQIHTTLAVYYAGAPVLDTLPIRSGKLDADASQDVPGALTVSVPRFLTTDDGRELDLLPSSSSSPLSADGTRLAVTYHLGRLGGTPEAINLGWFRIAEWAEGDGTVDLTATSLEAVIQEARFLTAATIAKGSTYATAAKALVAGLLPVRVTASPAIVGASQSFEEDRIAALHDLLAAWPARMFVDDSGALTIAAPFNDTTDASRFTLTDGQDGTVVKAPRSGSRDGVYNAVKASGETDGDVAPVSGVAYLTDGPRRWNGPFGNVPYFMASPLLTTKTQAQSAAASRLANLQHQAAPVTVEAAPDPRFQIGDVLTLNQRNGTTRRLRVDTLSLPLTAADGTMTITGHEV